MSSPLDDLRRILADRYDVVREVGRGGMATVYLAHAHADGRAVAVKVLNPDLAGSVGAERFLREIRIAEQLQHPGILALLDSGNREGVTYYVMPFVEGESLREKLTREGSLPIEEAVRLAIETGEALEYAHTRGIVHRDIKPENLLLANGKVAVSDFGIARAVDQAGSDKLTETGLAVGTPTYMSPEQWMGDKIDGRVDQYALGCVLFEMLVGEPPFSGPSPHVVMARHSMEPVPSMRVARATIAPALEDVVRRALSKVAADRFATADEFVAALRSVRHEATRAEMAPGAVAAALNTPPPIRVAPRRRMIAWPAAALALAVVVLGGYWWKGGAASGRDAKTRVVVLPFRNVGAPADMYFSDGLTEEITSRLSSVNALGVIARTSASQYRNSDKSVKQIGSELDVRYVLEGSVRWNRKATAGQGVRITVRLIDVEDDTPLWSDTRSFDMEEVFTVEANVAEEVVKALSLAVLEPERLRLTARPTDNVTAYDFLLRGNSYYNRSWAKSDVDSAAMMYEQATLADPEFALAWAQLGKTHAWIYRLGFDETAERLARAREAIDKAIALDPNLPETHIAQGLFFYWGEWEFEKAITELTKARQIQPSNAWVHLQLGNVRRRQGLWAEAVRAYEEAGRYDPRFHVIWFNIAHLRMHVRQSAQVEEYLDRTITLQPKFLDAYLLKTGLQLGEFGNLDRARQLFDSAAIVIPPNTWRPLAGYWLNGAMRTYKTAEERLRMAVAGNYGLDSTMVLLVRAEALAELGRAAPAKATLDSAITALEAVYVRTPKADWLSGALAVAYAHAGRREDALMAAKRARTLQADALDGPTWIFNEARVMLLVGDTAGAITNLGTVLSIPSGVSVADLKHDPAFAPLRNNPQFKALLAKGSPPPPTF